MKATRRTAAPEREAQDYDRVRQADHGGVGSWLAEISSVRQLPATSSSDEAPFQTIFLTQFLDLKSTAVACGLRLKCAAQAMFFPLRPMHCNCRRIRRSSAVAGLRSAALTAG